MDVTETATPPLPDLRQGPKTLPPAATIPASDPKWQVLLDQALMEIARQTGEPAGRVRDELLLSLLEHPGELGDEALRQLGPKPHRLREELLRLMGRGTGDLRTERTHWPLLRWAWITAVLSVGSYPISVGPVLSCLKGLGLEDSLSPVLQMIYAPLEWLYESSPWVKAFYDWYLPIFGLS